MAHMNDAVILKVNTGYFFFNTECFEKWSVCMRKSKTVAWGDEVSMWADSSSGIRDWECRAVTTWCNQNLSAFIEAWYRFVPSFMLSSVTDTLLGEEGGTTCLISVSSTFALYQHGCWAMTHGMLVSVQHVLNLEDFMSAWIVTK